jgi:hypothetical protein
MAMHYERKGEKNRVVVHFKDGRLIKGYTTDFVPARDIFHLVTEDGENKERTHEIRCSDLKAVFFVKTLEGDKDYEEKKHFDDIDASGRRGLKIKVEFSDGEVIRGMSFDYSQKFNGFFIMPVDPQSNNGKIYVIADDLLDVKTGPEAED